MRDNEKLAMLQFIIEEYEKAALRKASRSAIAVTLNGPLSAMERMNNSARNVVNSEPSEFSMDQDDDSDLSLRQMYNDLGETQGINWIEECLNCNFRPLEPWQVAPIEWINPLEELLTEIGLSLDAIDAAIEGPGPIPQICLLLDGVNGLTCPQDILIMIQALTMLFRLRSSNLLKIRLDWSAVLGPMLSVVFDAVGNILGWVETLVLGILDCLVGAIGTIGNIQAETGEAAGLLRSYVQRPREVDESLGVFEEPVPDFSEEFPFGDDSLAGQLSESSVEWPPTEPVSGSGIPQEGGFDSSFNLGSAGTVDTTGFITGKQMSVVRDGANLEIGNVEDIETRKTVKNQRVFNTSTFENSQDEDFLFGSKTTGTSEHTLSTGIEITSDMTLDEAIRLPGWASASWATQLNVSLLTARGDVAGFIQNLKLSIYSLKRLTSGSIRAQVEATQTLLYLTSLIKLLIAVYKIIKSMPDIQNWCDEVEKNPSSIEPFLAEQFPEYKFETVEPNPDESGAGGPTAGAIKIIHESAHVSTITGCSSKRNGAERDRMNQWINRLHKMGVV